MTEVPISWIVVPIIDVLQLNENGKPFQQGWSPQCESYAASDDTWGVLKTTAIQPGQFWGHENKELPQELQPRPHIEVQAGDLLMTCAGPRSRCGVVCLVERTRSKLMMSGRCIVRPSPDLMTDRFLAYFIQSRNAQLAIDRMKTGISDSGLNLTHDRFATLAVPLPPLGEQLRIVAKIEELFSELEEGAKSLVFAREQLEAYRQSVLRSALCGELTGADLEGWTEHTVGQLATDIRYGTAKKCAFDPAKTPVLRIPNVANGRVELADLKHADFTAGELSKLRLEAGDILIVRSNGSPSLVGLSAIVTDETAGYAYAGYLIRLRVDRDVILPEFLNLYLHSPMVRAGIERQARSSSGVHNINSDEIRAIALKVPSIPVQRNIVAAVSEVRSQIEALELSVKSEIARSSALRHVILQQAFSGQLIPQDPSDERASAHLDRTKAERAHAAFARRRRAAA